MSELRSFSYSGRKVPLKFYLPAERPAPLILLSHGLGGSRETGAYLAQHWAGRGFCVVAMQHPGSDSEVWKKAARSKRLAAMKRAASPQSFFYRIDDVQATLEQLKKWNEDVKHPLFRSFDWQNIGMAGHSFGAITTQALSGQRFSGVGAKYTDPRIKAALALSPSAAQHASNHQAFSQVKIPWMLMTGTRDTSVIRPQLTAESRQQVYAALPNGKKIAYQLVLKGAQHMAFSDRTLLGKKQRNPNHHRLIKSLSTAFWETHLKSNKAAYQWLHGDQPQALLQTGDQWQWK